MTTFSQGFGGTITLHTQSDYHGSRCCFIRDVGYQTTLVHTQKDSNQHGHRRENFVEHLDPFNSRLRFTLEGTKSAKENVRRDSIYLYWNIISGKEIQNLNVSEQVLIERKIFNYIEFMHKYFPADLLGHGLAWADSQSSAQALLYPERCWWNTDVDRAEPGMDPVGHWRNNFQSTFRWSDTNVM